MGFLLFIILYTDKFKSSKTAWPDSTRDPKPQKLAFKKTRDDIFYKHESIDRDPTYELGAGRLPKTPDDPKKRTVGKLFLRRRN